jgi:3'(2'), 5'-bisphosphate nucleotidase
LSEESAHVPFAIRQQWTKYWLVDPLDGTKEFVTRNGEFTVNIALMSYGKPVLGVVHVPGSGISYLGLCETVRLAGRCEPGQLWQAIHVSPMSAGGAASGVALRVVASRRHGAEALDRCMAVIKERYPCIEMLNMGSSLKFCVIAQGRADVYPRLSPTSEWDTAAAHAVLRGAGGDVLQADLSPLVYNTRDSLLNPSFVAVAAMGQDDLELLGRAMSA